MIKFIQIKMILNGWMRNRMSSFISLLSLVVGLTCSTMLLMFVVQQYQVASSLGSADDIFMVRDGDPEEENSFSSVIMKGFPLALKESYPEVEAFTVVSDEYANWFIDGQKIDFGGGRSGLNEVYSTLPSVDSIFNFPMVAGSVGDAISYPDKIVLTQSTARKLFGDASPLGRTLTKKSRSFWFNGKMNDPTEAVYTVAAIVDDSRQLMLNFAGLIRDNGGVDSKIKSQIGNTWGFVKLKNSNASAFCEKVNADTLFLNSFAHIVSSLDLMSLKDVYFRDEIPQRRNKSGFAQQDKQAMFIGFAVAFVILLIAVFNHINITMTRAAKRLRNIAGQRILGASKWNVRLQTVADTAMMVMIAFLLTLIAIDILLPRFNDFMGSDIRFSDLFTLDNMLLIVLLLVVLVILPSLYILSKIELKHIYETFKSSSTQRTTMARWMVITQFILSVALIATSINVSRQMSFINGEVPHSDNILMITAYQDALSGEFCDKVSSLAGVDAHMYSSPIPRSTRVTNDFTICELSTTPEFFDFYDFDILQGRALNESDAGTGNTVVNETMVKQLDTDGPIGRKFDDNKYTVVGVIRDYRFDQVKVPIRPMAVIIDKQEGSKQWILSLRCGASTDVMVEQVKQIWHDSYPDQAEPTFQTLKQQYTEMNADVDRFKTMVQVFTWISLFLSAMGLFGLAWYTVEQRIHEIAIRKVHGATVGGMVLMLCRNFVIWILISIVIALPLAYWLTGRWLESFVYKIPNSIWVLVLTALIATAITLLTVIFQTVRAARTNPASVVKNQ